MRSNNICLSLALIGALAGSVTAQDQLAATKSKTEKKRETKKKPKKEPAKEEPDPIVPQFVQAPPDAATVARVQARPANGSLFTPDARQADLLSDFRARNVGDLVFVDVIEGSSASVTSGAKRSRDSGTLGGLVTAAGALPAPGAAVVAGAVGALGNRKYEGKGSTTRETDLKSRIAARVIEVLPNGDLRIEAYKAVRINQETERLLLYGIVRQRDLTSDNVVPTTSVGDLRVELNGKGVASADNAPGWLFRFFEKVTPF
ncbi:MAG: flagellar basal body L-ring protein FlgH [Blastocatellia bacterium]